MNKKVSGRGLDSDDKKQAAERNLEKVRTSLESHLLRLHEDGFIRDSSLRELCVELKLAKARVKYWRTW